MTWKSLLLVAGVVAAVAGAATAAPVEAYIDAAGPTGTLKGTMLTPAGAANPPVVLIIPGSGPTDRDGDSPLGVKASTYRLLAEGLAERGIASVRIDKRGMFASAAAAPDPNAVTLGDYAADAKAWAAAVKARTGAPCVWMLGHSEGALVAEVTALESADLCGLVLASPAGRRMSDSLREQIRANPANAPLLDQAEQAVAELEAGRKVDVANLHPALQTLFHPTVQGFLISLFAEDPAALLARYRGPVLILHGTTDLQLTGEDAARLAQARPGVVRIDLEGVNHVLKAAPADRRANAATYADPSLPLAPGVADAIADFVKARR